MLNLEANLRLESIYLGITSRSYYYLPPLAFNYFQLFIIARDITHASRDEMNHAAPLFLFLHLAPSLPLSLSLSLSLSRARALSFSLDRLDWILHVPCVFTWTDLTAVARMRKNREPPNRTCVLRRVARAFVRARARARTVLFSLSSVISSLGSSHRPVRRIFLSCHHRDRSAVPRAANHSAKIHSACSSPHRPPGCSFGLP